VIDVLSEIELGSITDHPKLREDYRRKAVRIIAAADGDKGGT
jgi:hypothetical protein